MKKRERRNGQGTETETKSGQILEDQNGKETDTEDETPTKQRADESQKIQERRQTRGNGRKGNKKKTLRILQDSSEAQVESKVDSTRLQYGPSSYRMGRDTRC